VGPHWYQVTRLGSFGIKRTFVRVRELNTINGYILQ
jgi:hypothetical protein